MKSIVRIGGNQRLNGDRAQSLRDEVRHLWNRLQVGLPAECPRALRLGFVATHPEEGTTTVAANFAIFLGEQLRRTCLVEANLRKPTLADHFRVPRSPGLTELLDGTAQLTEALESDVAPLVDLLRAGGRPEDPYAVFGNGGAQRLVEMLQGSADVLVFDCPPLSVAPEAGPILLALDTAVLVVRANRTRRQAVEKSLATFRELGVPFCGAVLNRATYDLPPAVEHLL